MENGNGVKISFKEIYQMVLDTSRGVQRIEDKIHKIDQTEERCREALDRSDDAMRMAIELTEQNKWLWRTVITAIITAAIGAIFYFMRGV